MIRPSKKTTYLFATVAFIVIIYLLQYVPVRFDFSKNNAYTLSPATKKILNSAKNTVTITFYVSSRLPSRLQPAAREVSDVLAEYKREGRGKVTVVTKDPTQNEKIKSEAQSYGVPELNFSQQEQDQFAVTTGYFGIGIAVNNQRAAIPQVANIEDLEYNLTSAIYKISAGELPRVGILGANTQEQQITTLRQVAASQFALEDAATPEAALKTVLVFDDRQKSFTEKEIEDFEQYVNRGGRLIFFVDGVWVSPTLESSSAEHNLYGFFKKYGITLNQNLVLSSAAEIVNFGGPTGRMNVLTAYPFWFRTQSFYREFSSLSNVRQLSFPWASSITIGTQKGIKTTAVVQSPKNSWEQKNSFTLKPQDIREPQEGNRKQFIHVAQATRDNGGSILVVASSRFVEDLFLSRSSDNLEFVINVMSDFAAGGALSGIRYRSVDLHPLPSDYSNQQKDMFKYLTILLLPGLFAAYGVVRLYKRK